MLRFGRVFTDSRARHPAAIRLDRPDAVPTDYPGACPAAGYTTATAGSSMTSGRPVLPGLISVGDAVCTTTPLAGRGVTLGLLQARELVRVLERAWQRCRLGNNGFRRLVLGQHLALVRRPSPC